jgi:hypothetical protein
MRKLEIKIFLTFAILIGLNSCKNSTKNSSTEPNKNLVTERIQYEVSIKTPDPDYDWWVQNIEGSKRESFVKKILDAAMEGKVKAYDSFGTLLSPKEVKETGGKNDTIVTKKQSAPFGDSIVVINNQLDIQKIYKLSFIEEWSMDPATLKFEKRILGFAPLTEKREENGDIRGFRPLFWVYFDDKYPLK